MDEPPSTAEQPRPARPPDGPPSGLPGGLPVEAERRAMQAIWWWRGAGLGFLALGAIKAVFDLGAGAAAPVHLILWPAISVMLGGVCVTQARCAVEFQRRGLIPGWLTVIWLAAVGAVPLLLFTGLLAGVMITADRGAIGPVILLALVFLVIGAGLFIVAAVDAFVAFRTGSPLLRLRHRPLVMGVLLFVTWSLEFAGVISFDRAHTYSFIVVMLAPWLLHLNTADEALEPTPRSAAA